MSLEKSNAIVLRSVPWSETSLVVTLWTEDFGKISAIAKGARRLKSPFESALDLLSLSSIVVLLKAGDSLDLLIEAKLQRRFRSAQRGMLPLYCGYHAADLVHALTENHQSVPGMLELLHATLIDLDRGMAPADVMLRMELHALQLLGHLPSFRDCVGCGEGVDPSQASRAFTPSGGGVVCPACTPSQRHVLRIDTATLQLLQEVSERPVEDGLVPIPALARGQVRWIMEPVLQHVAERRLRLLCFLEELKR